MTSECCSRTMTDIPIPPTLGLVLAGGLARRMGGGDKARIEIGGVTILDRVLATLSGAMHRHHHQRQWRSRTLRRHRLTVVPDNVPDFAGPLAGILAGLDWLAAQKQRRRMDGERAGRLPVPARRSGRAAACRPGARWAPACRWPARARANGGIRWSGLWPLALREDLRKALVEEDLRKIEVWTARHGVAIADWPDQPIDPFFNVNTPEDAERAERIALQHN